MRLVQLSLLLDDQFRGLRAMSQGTDCLTLTTPANLRGAADGIRVSASEEQARSKRGRITPCPPPDMLR